MKKLGCVFMLIGLLLLIGGVLTLGRTTGEGDANRVAVVPLTIGSKGSTDLITVKTDKLCAVGYSMEFRGKSSKEDDAVQRDFPFSYTVFEEDGQELCSGTQDIDWAPDRDATNYYTSRIPFKFQVGPPGKIRVEAEIGLGSYASDLKSAELIVWDNVPDQTIVVLIGSAMLSLGALIGFVGMVLFVFGFIKGRKNAAGPPIHFTGVKESS